MLYDDKQRFDNEQKALDARVKADHISNIANLKAIQTELDEIELDLKALTEKERSIGFDCKDLDDRIQKYLIRESTARKNFLRNRGDKAQICELREKAKDCTEERKTLSGLLQDVITEKKRLISRKEVLWNKYQHDKQSIYSYLSDTVYEIPSSVKSTILRSYSVFIKTGQRASFLEWLGRQFPRDSKELLTDKFDEELDREVEKILTA